MMHKKQGAQRLTKGKRLLGAAMLALLSAGAMAQQAVRTGPDAVAAGSAEVQEPGLGHGPGRAYRRLRACQQAAPGEVHVSNSIKPVRNYGYGPVGATLTVVKGPDPGLTRVKLPAGPAA